MTSPEDRLKALEILDAVMAAGARACKFAELLGVGLTTLQRWRRQFAGDGDGTDRRKGGPRLVSHRLSDEERQRILFICNQAEFAALPPGQIVPILAYRGLYNSFGVDFAEGSERSFYRVLHAHGQAYRRGLYLAVDVWSCKIVAWDVAEREDAQIAADLDSRACLRERISKGRPQPLILHADNGNAMRAATLERRLEELGVLRSFSMPRPAHG